MPATLPRTSNVRVSSGSRVPVSAMSAADKPGDER